MLNGEYRMIISKLCTKKLFVYQPEHPSNHTASV